jgi:hypothetical protein
LDERFTARAFKTTAQCSIARKGLQRGAAIRRANALGAEPEAGRATVGSIEVLVHVVAEPGRYARQPWAR